MNLDKLEALADAAIIEVEPGIYYSRPEAYEEYLDHCSPQTIKALIALCRMQYEALKIVATGDIVWSRKYVEALAAFDNFNKGE